jgi:hypothetical protein
MPFHLWSRQFIGTPILGACIGIERPIVLFGQDPVEYDSVSLLYLDSFKPHRNGVLIAAFRSSTLN